MESSQTIPETLPTQKSSDSRSLLDIESISGNDYDVRIYLIDYLRSRNFTVETQDVGPLHKPGNTSNKLNNKPRFNVLSYPGNKRETRVMLSSHIDTAPPYWPYEIREGGMIYGRGTVDAKGCVAAQTIAVEELLSSKEVAEGDVALLFVVGEEVKGDGMRAANHLGLTWEAAIFGEPTELKLTSGHKGVIGFVFNASGTAGHSRYLSLGDNANHKLLKALYAIQALELLVSDRFGETTLNIGKIEGGVAGNVIPERAMARIAMRLVAGTPEEFRATGIETVKKVDESLEVIFTF
jgi:acetylornithine deacetylase